MAIVSSRISQNGRQFKEFKLQSPDVRGVPDECKARDMDYDVEKFTRRCAATGREFQPGDVFYSMLIPAGAAVQRRDVIASAWTGAPENAICWWKAEMPSPSSKKLSWAPNEVVLDYFLELQQRVDNTDQLYVLTLLMIRRRIVRLEEIARDESQAETLVVYCANNETEYRVTVVEPEPERIAQIEQELTTLLFSHAV